MQADKASAMSNAHLEKRPNARLRDMKIIFRFRSSLRPPRLGVLCVFSLPLSTFKLEVEL
jgi:hypothetical protein